MKATILEALPNPVIIYDSGWNVHWMNRSALEFVGYASLDDVLGIHITRLFLESSLPEISEIQHITNENASHDVKRELHHLHRKGHGVKILARFGKFYFPQPDGQVMYIESGIPSDEILDWHHEQYDRLQYYKILAENVPGIDLMLVDSDYKILCNVGSEILRQGWAKPVTDEKTLPEYFPREIMRILEPLLMIAFESTPVSRELSVANKQYYVRLTPLMDDFGRMTCVIILQNITETKLAEKKLKLSKKEADEANNAKSNFIAKMSHEIRTPLNAVIGFAEQLRKTRLSKKQSEYLNIIHSSSQHLLSIIDEILVLSKIESGEVHLEEIPFKISNVLQAVHDVVELRYKEKNLEYFVNIDPALDVVLLGDEAKLRQILINLISNAIKFTKRGSVSVEGTLIKSTRKVLTVRFSISDTGIGIADENLKTIFRPFHQVDNSIGRTYSGTGLGLTISKDLIETMGGILTAQSRLGKESVFSFVLKFQKHTNPDYQLFDTRQAISMLPLRHVSVLFVDDDPVNRMLGKEILKQLKIKTVFASSGKTALRHFKPGRFHVVLLDINMPGINGIEVAKAMRSEEANAPTRRKSHIIAMTANVLKKHIEQYLAAGMDDVILKPFKEEYIYEKIVLHSSDIPIIETEVQTPIRNLSKETTPTTPPFDLSELIHITRGDKDFLLLMLEAFIKNTSELLALIQQNLLDDDYPQIAEAAHRLLPSAQQLGLARVTPLLLKIENRYLRKENYRRDATLIKLCIGEITLGLQLIKDAETKIRDNNF
ncbi:MAG: PAS domain-containing sensor histidine kinase [Clostridia bacterium]|nr:PAS domain-containing sensor histidine kinase [Clostridia bacterium]